MPSVTADVNVTETNPLEVQYGFNMDNVAEVKNLSTAQPQFKPMLYYPDPFVAPFDVENQEMKFQDGEWLTIEVKIFCLFYKPAASYVWWHR